MAGDITKWFCIPLSILLHDELQPASSWEQSAVSTASHVMQMIENGYQAAKTFGDSLFLLDRCLLSVPSLNLEPRTIIRLYSYRNSSDDITPRKRDNQSL